MSNSNLNHKNYLEKKGKIILHTHPARHYLLGRTNGSIGVFAFAKQVSQLWRAAAYDDPYADFWLLRLDDAFVKTQRYFDEEIARYTVLLNPHEDIRFERVSRTEPFIFPLQLATPYAGLAVRLLTDFDGIVRMILAAQHNGIPLPASPSKIILATGDRLRSVLTLPQRWKSTGITRADIVQKTALADQVRELMGELPLPVLEKILRAKYAPRIRPRKAS